MKNFAYAVALQIVRSSGKVDLEFFVLGLQSRGHVNSPLPQTAGVQAQEMQLDATRLNSGSRTGVRPVLEPEFLHSCVVVQ